MALNLDEFEASYSEEDGGCHFIEKEHSDHIRIPRLDNINRVLHCDFEVLMNDYSNEEIEELVFIVLLHRLCLDSYLDEADFVEFHNIKSTERWKIAYVF